MKEICPDCLGVVKVFGAQTECETCGGTGIVSEEIHIEIPGKPVPWSVKVGKHGQYGTLVSPDHVKAWQEYAAMWAKIAMKGRKPIGGAVRISLVAVFSIPKKWPKAKREATKDGRKFHISKPDLTNILKATEDSFKNIVWTDDSAVCRQEAFKTYGEKPMVSVIVKPIEEVAG